MVPAGREKTQSDLMNALVSGDDEMCCPPAAKSIYVRIIPSLTFLLIKGRIRPSVHSHYIV